MKCGLTFTCRL